MVFNFYGPVYINDDSEQLDRIEALCNQILTKENQEIMTLDEIQQKVNDEGTVIGSAVTLLGSLSQMLKDAIAANDPSKLSAIADALDAQKATLAAAITANTPAA